MNGRKYFECKVSPIVEMTRTCASGQREESCLPPNMAPIQLTRTTQRKNQRAFILLPVIFTLTILAAVAYLLSREGAVNAGNVNREQQQDSALYIAQAGYQHAVWWLNRQNCTGYADIPDTSFGSHSYLAEFTDITGATITAGSPVNIKVVGSYANGASYTISRNRVKIYQYPLTTVTFQLGTDSGKDATIFANYFSLSKNYGNYTQKVSHDSFFKDAHELIYFDISSLPADASIISAQLVLKQDSAFLAEIDAKINVYRITQYWIEGTKSGSGAADGVTWETTDGSESWEGGNGGSYDASIIASTNININTIVRHWDISALVQGWHKAIYKNEGVLLKGSGLVSVTFASKENSIENDRPKLTITYACECGKCS